MSASKTRDRRRLDVVLWGATGFTGELVAEYLVRRRSRPLRWALGGRSRAKLEAVRARLAAIDPAAANLEIMLADAGDVASLEAMVSQARVVATTVGPYLRYGTPLVKACARLGVDYCDLTGEPAWMRQTIDACHELARESGARIVHCCGFDSIPSDLGCWLLQRAAKERLGQPCGEVRFYLTRSRGGFSGGTVASMLETVALMQRDRAARRLLADPYALDPAGAARGPDGPDLQGVRMDPGIGRWTAPFIMAAVNTRVVRRSNALLAERGLGYGSGFRYSEVSATGAGPAGALRAAATVAGMGGFLVALSLPPTRAALARWVLPGPGEGPSRAKRDAGSFAARLLGWRDRLRPGGADVEVKVAASGDPGYKATSLMIAESAICLARGADSPGGVLTPACIAAPLVQRLRRAGMTLDVV